MAASIIATFCVVFVTGCSFEDPVREANLRTSVSDFDADSIGAVFCEYSEGSAGPSNGYSTVIYLQGEDAWGDVLDRLTSIGFELEEAGSDQGSVRFDGRNGVFGVATIVDPEVFPANGDASSVDRELSENGCPNLPAEGLIGILFNERPPV